MAQLKNNDELAGKKGYVKVVFTTNSSVKITANSPTRKVNKYGYFSNLAEIYVHKDDQKRMPNRYVLIKPPTPQPEPVAPTTPKKRRGRPKKKVAE